jgi:lysozyme family protein
MASANKMASFLYTMKWEGRASLSMNRNDPGNWAGGKVGSGELVGSKFGVSAPVLAKRFPGVKMADLTSAQALTVFDSGYWQPCHCDALSVGLDHAVSDNAYNAGPGTALRILGAALAAKPTDAIATIHVYSQRRLGFLEGLRTWKIFGKGWAARVAGVEAESVAMAHAAGAALVKGAESIGDHLSVMSLQADDKASAAHKTSIVSGVAVLGTALASSNHVAVSAVTVAGVLTAIHSMWISHVQTQRREALGDAADTANMLA